MRLLVFFVLLISGEGTLAAHPVPNDRTEAPGLVRARADTLSGRRWQLWADIHTLISTHNTFFNGISLTASYQLRPKLWMGVGGEFAYNHFHNDNGWKLHHLRLTPVFVDLKVLLGRPQKLTPFLQLASGVSYNRYLKEIIYPQQAPFRVAETGLYLFTGGGLLVPTHSRARLYLSVGFKGYRMSRYDLDVNPHGITLRLGVNL